MAEIRWTPQAIEDIENIAKYIAKDSTKYASIQVEEFFEAALLLEDYPRSGRIVPEIGNSKSKTPTNTSIATIFFLSYFVLL